MEPFKVTGPQWKYIIMAIIYYTKWSKPEAMVEWRSGEVRRSFFRMTIARHRAQRRVISDIKGRFKSLLMSSFKNGELNIRQKQHIIYKVTECWTDVNTIKKQFCICMSITNRMNNFGGTNSFPTLYMWLGWAYTWVPRVGPALSSTVEKCRSWNRREILTL